MMHREPRYLRILLGAGALLLIPAAALTSPPGAVQKPVQKAVKPDFAHDLFPVLKASCFQCHGAAQQQAGLRLDTREFLLKGGVSGAAVVPGSAAKSALVLRLAGAGGKARMPLGFAPLSAAQIAEFRAWIDEGAPWPASVNARHWAYIAPIRHTPPVVKNSAWVRNPIDNFVLARMAKAGLRPSPEAPKEILIRRVSLDLIGLPPTPAEIDAFLADHSPNAYDKVVDRLLASPHYGERWARPWLDLARYADTNGYEKDLRRSIWPYRDWVINAFNADMPYDEFTVDQLAGDMLPNATLAQKVATGFHRNTMLNEEGGVDQGEQRWLTIVDRVSTTASVWLGSTLQCAECHNHKYDPFSNRDYYRFFAFFEHADEPSIPDPSPEQAAKQQDLQNQIKQIEALQKSAAPGAVTAAFQDNKAKLDGLKKQLAALNIPTTLVMQEKTDGQTPSTYMRVKGGYLAKADLVTAAVPEILPPLAPNEPVNRLGLARWLVDERNPLTARVEVNRLWEQLFGQGIVATTDDFGTQGQLATHPELLDWLATTFIYPQTSQTLRTTGHSGYGWHIKPLLRLIVTSATYRQSSHVTPHLEALDPQNKLLARGPRFRMEAEMLRDSALSAAGLLSPKIGGPSVFPVQPPGIWVIPYNGDQWNTSAGEDAYRRGLYTFWRRTSPYPSFVSFDATSREFCTVRRIRTTTPLQALTTLNDPAFFDAARGLARRVILDGGADPRMQIALGFRLCTARKPEPAELTRLLRLYNQELANYGANAKSAAEIAGGAAGQPLLTQTAALTIVSNVLLNLDESLTKE